MMHCLKRSILCAVTASIAACGGGGGEMLASNPPGNDLPPLSSQAARPWNEVFPSSQGHTIRGNVSIIQAFSLPQLGKTRRIWIYLPSNYETSTDRYQVLYMQDGQNVFDSGTSYAGEWEIDETMLRLEKDGVRPGTIVVAIDNGGADRSDEYLLSGHAKQYADFIASTLKPYIDANYRTLPDRKHTTIAGSSFGAYISLYTALSHQDIFGNVAAFSNVLIYDSGRLLDEVAKAGKKYSMRIYMDVGQLENSQFFGIISSNEQLSKSLIDIGFNADQLKFVIDPVGYHNEESWRRRFPAAWDWINS